ncbi:MAG: adenylosuccinate synthase [Candidatus Zixiibacteriota bacterium]
MPNRVVLGAQWGDEGKGKIVDILAAQADWVVRYSGGANAGHTVKIDDHRFALHLVPTGMLIPSVHCLIGNGVVIDLPCLFAELDQLAGEGIKIAGRLQVAANAHLVLPHHKLLEAQAEELCDDAARIGTTMRGIGPAYADKIARRGIRAADLADTDRLRQRLDAAIGYWDRVSHGWLSQKGCNVESVLAELRPHQARLVPMLTDASLAVQSAMHGGKSILFEGAQGTLLDIDFGTYPYVTSSNTTIGGAFTGLGIPPRAIDQVIGVVKAYTTRVGRGPFPTELTDSVGALLQERGLEYGTTTGRKRRCGWLDLVALKYAVRISGITHIALTKLDVLDTLAEISVCVAYDDNGTISPEVPMDLSRLDQITPIYQRLPGWQSPSVGLTNCDRLPDHAKQYLHFICDTLGVEPLMVSTGAGREETIVCG